MSKKLNNFENIKINKNKKYDVKDYLKEALLKEYSQPFSLTRKCLLDYYKKMGVAPLELTLKNETFEKLIRSQKSYEEAMIYF
ncbi:hypothetical protein K9L67_03335 [Candidatus Woesearchaeota archaeon]|nr:hypothetical protein [Candidatus Woesearchaeota archaeon]MCF7901235.1 hypothetical protein [Candidatus Woesearchaeota archaeon]MCF8013764.1 hypothetical protein [Candidatus Woesearchaeota archaeon]